MMPAIPQLRAVREGLYSAGQPGPADWPALARAGIGTVLNLRPQVELGERNEAAEVRAAGMAYANLPVDGLAGLTREAAAQLWSALDSAKGGVLVHCGTGNRVGALLALAGHWYGGMPAEAALDFGRAGGLLGAELAVRQKLGLPA